MTGRVITKSAKGPRVSADVLPEPARAVTHDVLVENFGEGLWVLLAEVGVDGPTAMAGELDVADDGVGLYRHDLRTWVIAPSDVPHIDAWIARRRSFIEHGSPRAHLELTDKLRGPITTEVRRRLGDAPWARHVTIGVRVLNALAREQLVALTDGHEPTLWELTGRIGVSADDLEPHSTDRIHALIDEACAELLDHPRVDP